jgi:DNA-binding CsgD family transcriptional regulator
MRDAAQLAAVLVEDANAAADVPAFRRALLARLTAFVGADSGALVSVPQPTMPDEPQVNVQVNIDESLYARFVTHRRRYWGALHRVVARLGSDGVIIDTDVYPARERSRLEPYVETLVPAGITSIVCTSLGFQSRTTALLCLNRHDRARGFGSRQAAALRSVVPLVGLIDAAVLSRCSMRATECDLRALSPREREVAVLIHRGLQNKEIAVVLGTSAETVRKQTCAIYHKLGVAGRVELVARFGTTLALSERS